MPKKTLSADSRAEVPTQEQLESGNFAPTDAELDQMLADSTAECLALGMTKKDLAAIEENAIEYAEAFGDAIRSAGKADVSKKPGVKEKIRSKTKMGKKKASK